jgi:cytochrome c1
MQTCAGESSRSMKLLVLLAFAFFSGLSISAGDYKCGSIECYEFSPDTKDKESLERGLSAYMNYCYGCHSLKYSRYKRVAEDLSIPLDIYEQNLIFDDSKIGDLMHISLKESKAIELLGAKPPDLTLEARLRSPEWVYTYLDTFYEDSSRPYGVNNKVYANVSMPHVLEDIQLELSEEEYDRYIADITNFLTYVSDPSAETRKQLGIYVILFLLIFTAFAYLVYREFKKDLK